jgi:hypothetical protein
MMNEEGCRAKGHLQINKIVLQDLVDLHNQLLNSNKFPFYNAEYYKVLPFIVELRNKGDKDINEIETCLDALYGVMLLRMRQKEITPRPTMPSRKSPPSSACQRLLPQEPDAGFRLWRRRIITTVAPDTLASHGYRPTVMGLHNIFTNETLTIWI